MTPTNIPSVYSEVSFQKVYNYKVASYQAQKSPGVTLAATEPVAVLCSIFCVDIGPADLGSSMACSPTHGDTPDLTFMHTAHLCVECRGRRAGAGARGGWRRL